MFYCETLSGHVFKRYMTVIGRWGAIVTKSFVAAHIAWAVFYHIENFVFYMVHHYYYI